MAEKTYFPSCVVNLNLRFEEKLQIRANQSDGSFQTEQLAANQGSGTFVLNRVPRKCSVHFQGHRQAATWNMTFDYRELPIDPRTISAATVEIHLGTVSADDFAAGMQRELRPGVRRSILQTRNASGALIQDTLVLLGPVDKWKVTHEESGATVHLEGRDLRGILLDSPLVSARDTFDYSGARPVRRPRRQRSSILKRLVTTANIVVLVQQILDEHDLLRALPPDQQIRAVGFRDEWPDGVIMSPGAASHIPRHRRGANGQQGRTGAAHSDMNFWDIITQYCTLVGAIPTMVGRELHIRYAPTLYSMISNKEERVPFQGGRTRVMEDGTFRGIRGLVYGRDIESMDLERSYSGNNKPKTVRVVSVSASTGRRGREQLMESTWPPRNLREARREGVRGNNQQVRDFVGGEGEGEVQTIRAPGVHSQAQLDAIARSYYEQIGRNELKGEISTGHLTSFGGTNADPDLLRLRVGDPIELLVDASRLDSSSPIVNTLNRTAQLPFSESVAEVQRILGDRNLCRAIVASARGNIMGVLRYYRVSGLNLEWSDESMKVKLDVQNYWTPRYDFEARDMIQQRRAQHPTDGHRGATASARSALASYPDRPPESGGTTATRVSDRDFLDSTEQNRVTAPRAPRQSFPDIIDSSPLDSLPISGGNGSGGSRWRG